MKINEWTTWEELKKFFGKFDYLSYLGLCINTKWEFHPSFDWRRKNPIRLVWVRNKKTDQLWHINIKSSGYEIQKKR